MVASDPDGRFLAVRLTVYDRPTLIVVVHAACGTDQAASFDAVRAAIAMPAGTIDVHLMSDTNNHACALDYHSFSPDALPPSIPSAGLHALLLLTQSLGGLGDAFRSLHPHFSQFTYTTIWSSPNPAGCGRLQIPP